MTDFTGRCYCGAVKYRTTGDPLFRGQCHCRECQYLSGGGPNVCFGMMADSFEYTEGEPATFTRDDLESPGTREFCSTCGTGLLTRSPSMPGVVIIKVGTLDDPSLFGMPEMAIYTCDKQEFHHVPDGVPAFDKLPG